MGKRKKITINTFSNELMKSTLKDEIKYSLKIEDDEYRNYNKAVSAMLNGLIGCCYPSEYDDWYDANEYGDLFSFENTEEECIQKWNERFGIGKEKGAKGKKTKEKHSKKKPKDVSYSTEVYDFSNLEDESLDESNFTEKKTIRFYRDYDNPDDYHEFNNIYDFDEFCDIEGIDVGADEVSNLLRRDITHCCIDPSSSRKCGKPMLMTEASYGALRWACAESNDELC